MTPRIPTSFVPRHYQMPIWEAFVEKRTKKRGLLVWPRRHGKDLTCLNILAYHALLLRVGNYYYYAPTYAQGEKIIWDGKDKEGRPFLSVFPGYPKTFSEDPHSSIESIDRRAMKIRLRNGSMFQIIGTDNEDSLVGANPVGCVFSEYSIMNPKAWELVRPILLENDGWGLFTYTARGLNHGYRLYENTKDHPSWHTEFHTVETALHNGQRVVTDEMIEEERRSGMIEDLIRQEFYNDWYASNVGAYYATEMRKALEEGRIGQVNWDPALPVHTAWDLGISDSTAIWFFQVDYNRNVNVIDSYSGTGEGLLHYIKYCKEKPYLYGTHFAPHDLKVRDFTTGKSRLEVALQHGFRFIVLPKLGVQDGIDAARALIPRCRFNDKKCFEGLEALRQYAKEESGLFDMNGRPIFRDQPKHDWSSHYADGFRYLSIAVDRVMCHNSYTDQNGQVISLPDEAIANYNILDF
jgi:phage terminase large subunit